MRFLYSILVLIGNEQRIAENVGFLWGLKGGWKRVGRCLEGVWKGYGRWLEGVWKGYGRWLEGSFQEVGRGFSRGLRRMVRGFSEGSTWLLVSSKGWGGIALILFDWGVAIPGDNGIRREGPQGR